MSLPATDIHPILEDIPVLCGGGGEGQLANKYKGDKSASEMPLSCLALWRHASWTSILSFLGRTKIQYFVLVLLDVGE